MKVKMGGIEFDVVEGARVAAVMFTPEIAANILPAMAGNQRKISQVKVNEWAKEMTLGKWQLSNDAAVVCGGEWLNAQHRLAAIISAGVPQPMLVMEAASPSVMRVIDGGHMRKVSDVLRMETGMPYSKDVAAISDKLLMYDRGMMTSAGCCYASSTTSEKKLITRQERIAFAEKHSKRIIEIVTEVRPLSEKNGPVLSVMMAGAAWFIIARADGEEAARGFIGGMYTGDNLTGAQKALRLQVLRDSTARKKLKPITKFGLILKAYVSHRNGTEPGSLMLKSNEAFPRV